MFAFSPTSAYSFPSGPNAITPPLWFVAPLSGGIRRITVKDVATFPPPTIRTIRL